MRSRDKNRRLMVTGVLFAFAGVAAAQDQSPTGTWKTMDDRTGKPRGIVRIYELGGRLFGKIERSLDPAEAKENCSKCTDDRKNKPVVGMVIIRDLQRRGSEYAGGDILDPETGIVYQCKLRTAENGKKLLVRGFLGISLIGRTQTWLRDTGRD